MITDKIVEHDRDSDKKRPFDRALSNAIDCTFWREEEYRQAREHARRIRRELERRIPLDDQQVEGGER